MDIVLKKVAGVSRREAEVVVKSVDERIIELRCRLENAKCRFDLCEDNAEIEAVIYELRSIEATLATLLKEK